MLPYLSTSKIKTSTIYLFFLIFKIIHCGIFNREEQQQREADLSLESNLEGEEILSRNDDDDNDDPNKPETFIIQEKSANDPSLPDDHVKAIHFNRDGQFNNEYHKEVFLGAKENELFAERQKYDQARKLREIFTWVDTNHDGHINPDELAFWVMAKTKEHFDEAQRTNDQRFQSADLNSDNQLTWAEFKAGFLYQHGVLPNGVTTIKELCTLIDRYEKLNENSDRMASLDSDIDEDAIQLPLVSIELDPDLKYKLSEYEIQWKQSDEDHNDVLNDMEFLDFLHPEYSKGMLSFMVSEILNDLDANNDGELTLGEFVSLPFGDDIEKSASEDEWIAARRDEFRDVVDWNKDGRVTVEELERYLDPLNDQSALAEAKQMIGFGDDNENGTLEVEELLKNSEFFTGSKLVDYAKAAHEEF